jgi:hypothetical protein
MGTIIMHDDAAEAIAKWMSEVVEVPEDGFPPCPFLKKSREGGKVNVVLVDDWNLLDRNIIGFLEAESRDAFVLACPGGNTTLKHLEGVVEYHLKKYSEDDIWLKLFHPDQEFPVAGIEYPVVVILKLSRLNREAHKLEGLGYYDDWDHGYWRTHVGNRLKLDTD